MSNARSGTYPVTGTSPQRVAAVLPRLAEVLRGSDVDAVCARETLPQALGAAVRVLHKARACTVVEPSNPSRDSRGRRLTRVYYRLGDVAATVSGPEPPFPAAQPDQMVAIASNSQRAQSWRNYQMASSTTVCTQLRLALLRECLATAAVIRTPIGKHLTRPYPERISVHGWSDMDAALTLWWWHHTSGGYTVEAARTMLALRMYPTLAARVTFPPAGSPPVLAPWKP